MMAGPGPPLIRKMTLPILTGPSVAYAPVRPAGTLGAFGPVYLWHGLFGGRGH
ncbi:MAG: hypothetical protein R2911_17805 [Caldilineaceae bacterium]